MCIIYVCEWGHTMLWVWLVKQNPWIAAYVPERRWMKTAGVAGLAAKVFVQKPRGLISFVCLFVRNTVRDCALP